MVLAFSIATRKIECMDEKDFLRSKESGEFFNMGHDLKYNNLLHENNIWDVEQAAHLLARENPDDHWWSNYPRTLEYQRVHRAMCDDFKNGKLKLIEQKDLSGNTIFVAENILYIQWAIDRGFNIPVPFIEFNQKPPDPLRACPKEASDSMKYAEKLTSVNHVSQGQLLTRKAIEGTYVGGKKKLSSSKWRKIFEKEEDNGLIIARMPEKQNNKVLYSQEKLRQWLIQEGHFAKVELEDY